MKKASQAEIEQVQSLWVHLTDFITGQLLGFKDGEISAKSINQEKVFYYMDNMLYLSSNNIKTTSSDISKDEKTVVIEKAAIQTAEFLWARDKYFSHPLLAMIHLSNQCLYEYRNDEDFKAYIELLKNIRSIQSEIVNAIASDDKEDIPTLLSKLKSILDDSNPSISDDKKEQIALSLSHQINFQTQGKLVALPH
jgi:hypothetical protein